MKSLKYLIINLTLIFSFQVSLFAQQNPVPPTKIGSILSEKFADASAGIKDIIAVNEKLEKEFGPQELEIKILYEKHKNLINELKRISESKGHPSISEKTLTEKINEVESAFCKLESQTKIVRSNFEKRETELFKEVYKKIAESLKVFAKEKGFVVILDSSQENNSVIIEGEMIDVTKEFIQFYNNRIKKN